MLGDLIGAALAAVGVTEERVSRLLGKGCHCGERKARLNALDAWARRVVSGKTERARDYLAGILGALPEDCAGCDEHGGTA